MKINKIKKNILSLIPFLVIFGSISSIFIFGKYASETNADVIATNQSNVVKENDVTYLGLYVKETPENPLPSHESEFYNNYSTFRQDLANFIPAINVDKEIDMRFNEIEINKCLSLFYFGPIRSTTDNMDYIYPIQYMFPSVKKYPKNKYVINISKTQADLLLEKRGIEKTDEGYYSLLYTPTNIKVDNVDYDFQIGNIYLEEDTYYNAVKEMLDEFVMVSYFYPDVLIKEHVYLLNDNDFQNKYYMDYITSRYNPDKNLLFVNHNNLKTSVDDASLLKFYYEDLSSEHWIAITVCLIASVLCVASILLLCLAFKTYKKWIYSFAFIFSTLLPFTIFKIIFEVTGNRYYFSSFSTGANSYILIGLFIIYFIFFLVHILRKKKDKDVVICTNL